MMLDLLHKWSPIATLLLLLGLIGGCNETKPTSDASRKEKTLALNGLILDAQSGIVDVYAGFYDSLYLLPVNDLVVKHRNLELLIQDATDQILSTGPASPDSLLFKAGLDLLHQYDSLVAGEVWDMLLIVETYQLYGVLDTEQLLSLRDSVVIKERLAIRAWEAAQERVER